jgi:hypothetical protein
MPKKFFIGLPHPDALVESSAFSASIPPDITYELHLPKKVISKGLLSRPQLETVVYACQCHETFLPNGQRA